MSHTNRYVRVATWLATVILSIQIGLLGALVSAQQTKPAPLADKLTEVSATVETEPVPMIIGDGAKQIVNQSQSTAPIAGQVDLAGKLPPTLRDQGLALLNQGDEKQRARLARELANREAAAAMPFLLSLLETDPSPLVRSAIVDRLGRLSHPQVREALKRCAVSDRDTNVALLALEKLRVQQNQELAQLLRQRLVNARANGDEAALRVLAQEQERWISLVRGTMLPAFMRVPPPIFSLKPGDKAVRVLAFGDFGNGSEEQKQAAAAMLQFNRKTRFDFAITLGDNFYSSGMESPSDPRWKTWWNELYDPLGIKVYATLGNHDWGFADSPAAEILYTQKSPSWRMPAPYYTFTAGPVQFFALDTNEVSEAQLLWLKDELEKSRARWKLVYGHHPIYSAGAHADNPGLIARLLPVLKGRADVYLAGHDHDLQHLSAEAGVHFFVSGGGGAGVRPLKPGPRSLFARDAHGFAVVEADAKQLKVRFIDTALNQLYEYDLIKPEPAAAGNSTR
ncbi:MAG: metallophosphoesterase [Acidobacteria bacterium]|nr:metallophosphoesterase [Acidobacteriota bacterium]